MSAGNLRKSLGMEESGSIGLEEIVHEESKSFFKDVDCTCISDNCKRNFYICSVVKNSTCCRLARH